jgi:CheY-like chemotaxis protein
MTHHSAKLEVLVVGDLERAEFSEAVQWLNQNAEATVVAKIEDAAGRLTESRRLPALILLAQSRPGQFAAHQIEQLRRLAPLSPVAAILGSWCEGETRSGKPCAGVSRANWHQWFPRAAADLERIRESRCPTWGQPLTASEHERWLALSVATLPGRAGLVAIHAVERESAEALADVCQCAGYATVWIRPTDSVRLSGAAAVLWDSNDLTEANIGGLRQVIARFQPSPVIAVLNFPRPDDYQRAIQAGAAAVISKPYSIEDILWRLDQTLGSPENRRSIRQSVA